MLRALALLLLCVLCAFGEHRIIKMVPFGETNLKIVFAQPIDSLTWQIKQMQDGRSFIDFEAVLTIPKRQFIFKDNSIANVAQNTPTIVRAVITLQPKSRFEVAKEKENLYIFIKPKNQADKTNTNETKSPKEIFTTLTQTTTNSESSKAPSNATKSPTSATKPNNTTNLTESTPANPTKPSNQTKPKETKPSKPAQIGKGKKIVVDAGHGGKDCGTKSVEGKCEKMIVLEVAKLLESELKSRGYVVYMTRNSDVYIDLRKRTEFANGKNADLFVSVHANSMPKDSPKTPSGVETYFLSPARSERAEQVAKAENQGDIDTMSHFATKSFLSTISSYHLVASHKLAIEIQSGILNEVRSKHNTHDGAVREGPFWVLAGALMPSVLIEIGYASHKDEGKLIAKKDYQKLLAQGIADGIDGYFLRNY